MHIRLLRIAWPAVLACTFGLQPAHADIYTWVDASGGLNVSNLAPPEGARVTNIVRASAPKIATPDDATRGAARQAEVQALAARVLALEDELELAKRQAPPPVDYRAIPAPPAMQYGAYPPSANVPYAVNAAQPMTTACESTWTDCGIWWGPSLYPTSVIVLRVPSFRRFYPIHGGRHVAARQPMRTSSVSLKR